MLDQQQYYFNRKNETPNESKNISNTFNEYFTNVTKNLNLCESTFPEIIKIVEVAPEKTLRNNGSLTPKNLLKNTNEP